MKHESITVAAQSTAGSDPNTAADTAGTEEPNNRTQLLAQL